MYNKHRQKHDRTFSPGTRQLLLTLFLWVPVRIKKDTSCEMSFFMHAVQRPQRFSLYFSLCALISSASSK